MCTQHIRLHNLSGGNIVKYFWTLFTFILSYSFLVSLQLKVLHTKAMWWLINLLLIEGPAHPHRGCDLLLLINTVLRLRLVGRGNIDFDVFYLEYLLYMPLSVHWWSCFLSGSVLFVTNAWTDEKKWKHLCEWTVLYAYIVYNLKCLSKLCSYLII